MRFASRTQLNPGFDGVATPTIQNGVVTAYRFSYKYTTDISPVRALTELRYLDCFGGIGSPGQLSDLSPLRGMKLTSVYCTKCKVSDLSPLEECKNLVRLTVTDTKVTPATVAALQKALPNCKIDWDDPAKVKTPQPAASGTK